MNIECSSCGRGEDADLRLVSSKIIPGARYIACETCRENKYEPRPLIILGFVYGHKADASRAVREGLYAGAPIMASETEGVLGLLDMNKYSHLRQP